MNALEETPKDAMDVLEDLLSKRKWVKSCLRSNVAQPEDIKLSGTIKVAKIYSNVLNNREKEPELYDAIKNVAPEWWDDETQITLNKDLTETMPTRSTRGSCGSDTSAEATSTSTTAPGSEDNESGTRSTVTFLTGMTHTRGPSIPSCFIGARGNRRPMVF